MSDINDKKYINSSIIEDKPIVMTTNAGGTNFVFSAIQGNKQIVAPIEIYLNSDNLHKYLETIISGFEIVTKELVSQPIEIRFALPAVWTSGCRTCNYGNDANWDGGFTPSQFETALFEGSLTKSDEFANYAIYYFKTNDGRNAGLLSDNIATNSQKNSEAGFYWLVAKPKLPKTSYFYGEKIPVAVENYFHKLPVSEVTYYN